MASDNADATDHADSEVTLAGGLFMAALLALVVAVMATGFYAFCYEFTDDPTVSTDMSGVIETAVAPGGQWFTVTFDGAIQEDGPTQVTVISPEGEILRRVALAPGVEKVKIPENAMPFPGVEHKDGTYEVVATREFDVQGRAMVRIESNPVLPYVPPGRLFGYSLVFGVLVTVALIAGGVSRD